MGIDKILWAPERASYVNDLKRSLSKRNWRVVKERPANVPFQWVTGTSDAKHDDYAQDRLLNHFPSVAGVAAKIHIFRNLRRNTLYETGLNYLDFFPMCFSFKNWKEKTDFIDFFRLFKCKCVLHSFVKKAETETFFTSQELYRVQVCLLFAESYIESKKVLLDFEDDQESVKFTYQGSGDEDFLQESFRKPPPPKNRPDLANGLIYSNSNFDKTTFLTEQDWLTVSSTCVENLTAIVGDQATAAASAADPSIPPSPLGLLSIPTMQTLLVRARPAFTQLYRLLSSTNILNAQIMDERLAGKRNGTQFYSRPRITHRTATGTSNGDKEKKNNNNGGGGAEGVNDDIDPPSIMQTGGKNLWILKPAFLSRARGVEVYDNMSNIFAAVQNDAKNIYVIQKYLDRPLCVTNRKFDIRLWVLMTSHTPMYLFLYNDSYFRISSSMYNVQNISSGIHVTNLVIQEKFSDYDGDWQKEIGATSNSFNITTFHDILRKMDEAQAQEQAQAKRHWQQQRNNQGQRQGPGPGGGWGQQKGNNNKNKNSNNNRNTYATAWEARLAREHEIEAEEYENNVGVFGYQETVYPPFSFTERWFNVTLPEIRKIVTATLKSCRAGYQEGRSTYHYKDRAKSFEIFGFDIMFDVDMHPWVIEVNMGPSMEHRNPVMSPLIEFVIEDMIKIVIDLELYSRSESYAYIERMINSYTTRNSSSSSSSSSSISPPLSIQPTYVSTSSFLSSPWFGPQMEKLVREYKVLGIDTGGWSLLYREEINPPSPSPSSPPPPPTSPSPPPPPPKPSPPSPQTWTEPPHAPEAEEQGAGADDDRRDDDDHDLDHDHENSLHDDRDRDDDHYLHDDRDDDHYLHDDRDHDHDDDYDHNYDNDHDHDEHDGDVNLGINDNVVEFDL